MGLKWIEAFDEIPLLALLHTMRDLDCFEVQELSGRLATAIRNRLGKILGPAVEPIPVKPKEGGEDGGIRTRRYKG